MRLWGLKHMKKYKNDLVPRLRFPEFISTGAWQKYILKDIADRIREKGGDKHLTTLSISAGIGFVSQSEKFSRDISGKQYDNYIRLKKGDFSYNKGNSKKFPQGCIYRLKEYEEAAVPNAFISFHFRKNYISDFFKGYFNNNFHGKQLSRFITSGVRSDGLLNINPDDFFSIILPTPREKAEQQKIADCLSSLDELITTEDKKLSLLKTYKKGLMQKLFPSEGETVPKLRFPEFRDSGEWEEKKLVEVITTVIPPTKMLASEYENEGSFPIIDQSQNYICGWTNDEDAIIKEKLPLIIFGDHTCVLKFVNFSFAQGADGIKIFKSSDFISEIYLYQYLLFNNVKQEEYKRHFSILKEKNVLYPLLAEEQKKIADCLSFLDDLISSQENKIKALKEHKKGLMQGLFPSIETIEEGWY